MAGSFTRNIAGTFGTRVATAVLNLAIAVVLSQYLGPSGKGVQSLLLTTITFILVFANLVGGATLVYLSPRHSHEKLVIPSYAWTFLTGICSYPVLVVLKVVDQDFILHTCLLAIIFSLTSVHTSLLIGRQKIVAANLIGFLQPFLLIIALLYNFVILGKHDIGSYIGSLYISFSLTYLFSLWLHIRNFGDLGYDPGAFARVIKDLFRLGFMNQVAHITQMLSFRLSYYILDLYHGEAEVGIYSNGVSLAESIWLIAKSISLVQYARVANTEDREESRRLTLQLARGSTLVSLAVLVPLVLLPGGAFAFIFGQGFERVSGVLITLSAGVLVYNYAILIGHYFSGTGRYRLNAISSAAGLLIALAMYFLFIPRMGALGAGIASSISYFSTTVLLILFLSKEEPGWGKKLLPGTGDLRLIAGYVKAYLRRGRD
jgi:O-antigen/teichoic acid export membrane protein